MGLIYNQVSGSEIQVEPHEYLKFTFVIDGNTWSAKTTKRLTGPDYELRYGRRIIDTKTEPLPGVTAESNLEDVISAIEKFITGKE